MKELSTAKPVSSSEKPPSVKRYPQIDDLRYAEKRLDVLRSELAELYRKEFQLASRGEDSKIIERRIASKRIEVVNADRLVQFYEQSPKPSRKRRKSQ